MVPFIIVAFWAHHFILTIRFYLLSQYTCSICCLPCSVGWPSLCSYSIPAGGVSSRLWRVPDWYRKIAGVNISLSSQFLSLGLAQDAQVPFPLSLDHFDDITLSKWHHSRPLGLEGCSGLDERNTFAKVGRIETGQNTYPSWCVIKINKAELSFKNKLLNFTQRMSEDDTLLTLITHLLLI